MMERVAGFESAWTVLQTAALHLGHARNGNQLCLKKTIFVRLANHEELICLSVRLLAVGGCCSYRYEEKHCYSA